MAIRGTAVVGTFLNKKKSPSKLKGYRTLAFSASLTKQQRSDVIMQIIYPDTGHVLKPSGNLEAIK